MGGLSILHWLIAAAWISSVVIPVAAADSHKTMTRRTYLMHSLGIVALVLIGFGIAHVLASEIAYAVVSLAALVGTIFVYLWSVHRTQDIGWSRWVNLLFLLPTVSLAWWIILMAKPSPREN